MIKICITDDHAVIREGIKRILNKQVDMKIVDEFESGEELLNKLPSDNYDILILDIGLPGRSGIDILSDIRKIQPKLPVIIFSINPEERFAIRAFKAGANAYLSKESPSEQLIKAIRSISTGGKYITSSIAEKLAENLYDNLDTPQHEKLSNREFEIMRMIAKGKSVKEIASNLSVSINTINTYRTRVFDKMGFKNNIELAHYVIQNKLFD